MGEKKSKRTTETDNKQENTWDHFDGVKSETSSIDNRTGMGIGRGYFLLSGLNTDNKVRVCIVVAGVLA